MKRRTCFGAVVVLGGSSLLALACDKPPPTGATSEGGAPALASSASGTSPVAAPASAAAATSASAATASSSGTWSGTYKSVAGSLYYPTDAPNGKEWKDFKWQGDDAGVGLGEGTMTVAVDGAGHVTGTAEGPLGPVTLNGVLEKEQLTAKIERKEADRGLTGTAIGKLVGDKLEGTMRLSLPEANVLRAATFSLTKK